MRVRTFELRLIAIALFAGWTITAGLVLLGYHPGGPVDILVGVAAGLPILVSLAGLAWPPVARGNRAFAALVWLGLASLLLLAPSIGGLLTQLLARGPQTLVPSPEAGYPWLLALLGTSLFSGLGIARRSLGETAVRRRRFVRGAVIAVALTAVVGSVFAAVAIGNDLALRDHPVPDSRFGPGDADREPPTCDHALAIGGTARVDVALSGDVDGKTLGSVDIRGVRSGPDFRWFAYVATTRELGQYGAARIGDAAWQLSPATGWQTVAAADVADDTLDAQVLDEALDPGVRAVAEMHGVSFFEGARARHCRVAIDGATFRAAFPQSAWLVGSAPLTHWRGELDYWVFIDGELGQVSGSVNGDAGGIVDGGLQGHLRATMIATERDRPHDIAPPGR
ncbi:MAG TPA: hypothetical protein VGC90_00015 [Candidatus Limnocylindrales bacterium]